MAGYIADILEAPEDETIQTRIADEVKEMMERFRCQECLAGIEVGVFTGRLSPPLRGPSPPGPLSLLQGEGKHALGWVSRRTFTATASRGGHSSSSLRVLTPR